MSVASPAAPVTISGVGVITGKPVTVSVQVADPGHGVVFYPEGTLPIPATLASVAHTDRGVTLANAAGNTLSIVEHFLCAAALSGLSDLRVTVAGQAGELPILDGSAQDWLALLAPLKATKPCTPVSLREAVFYRHNDQIAVYALPDTHFKITYSLDFDHPDLKNRFACWDSQMHDPALIAKACTFGYLNELPALHARGLALGASLENSLGLTEDGAYTRPLRHADEPIFHKMLDLIGDLSLSGLNPLALQAHVFALNAGHSSHVPFARLLKKATQAANAF